MKRVILTTTSLVFAGGMAAAEVEISGFAEMGVSGKKSTDAKLHKDIDIGFDASGATDTGLSFGLSIDLDNAAAENNADMAADKGQSTYDAQGNVHISGAFGTLTLGDTDGAFDKALTEPWSGSAGSIADDHTSHPGNGGGGNNNGIDGWAGNSGNILRYDYTLGTITTSVSGEFDAGESSNSSVGIGVAWTGDVGGIGIGVGIGYQDGSKTTGNAKEKASIVGASVKVDMGDNLSTVLNASSRDDSAAGSAKETTYTGMGVAYSVGDLTIGVNGGRETIKGTGAQTNSGAGFAASYGLGSGVTFQVGAGAGKKGGTSMSSWSAGLAFSF